MLCQLSYSHRVLVIITTRTVCRLVLGLRSRFWYRGRNPSELKSHFFYHWPESLSILLATFTPLRPLTYLAMPR